jgi:hypothetical protein
MMRSLVTACAALTLLIACSLVYRPSDYFDPAGQLTVIATPPDTATTIVLTSSLVVFATSTGIYAVPKSGGAIETLAMLGDGDLSAMASNGTDLVAWCGPAIGVQAWRPGASAPITVDSTVTNCGSIDVNADNIGVAFVGDTTPNFVGVYRGGGATFALDVDGETPLADESTDGRVSLTDSGIYYASGHAIGRQREVTDPPIGDPYCGLEVGGGAAHEFQVVAQPDGGVLSLYRATIGFRFDTNNTCCILAADSGPHACAPAPPFIVDTDYLGIVIRGDYVYYLSPDQLMRASSAAPQDASTLRTGLGQAVGSLAVDDGFAYFGVGNQILKLTVPP